MDWRDHPLSVLLALSLIASSSSARAQEVSDDEFNLAVQALEAGNYPRAADQLSSLYEREQTIRIACNLALAYDRWGDHLDEAIEAYDNCARLDASGNFHEHAWDRARALRDERQAAREAERESEPEPTPAPTPVVVVPDPQPQPQVPPPETDPPPRGMLWGGVAVAVVGGALVVGGAVAASNGQNDLDNIMGILGTDGNILRDSSGNIVVEPMSRDAELLESARQKRAIALGLYVGGGALVALGAALVAINLATAKYQVQTGLAPTPGGATAHLRLRF